MISQQTKRNVTLLININKMVSKWIKHLFKNRKQIYSLYRLPLWDIYLPYGATHMPLDIKDLQNKYLLQNKTIRIFCSTRELDRIIPFYKHLNILKFKYLFAYKRLQLLYKTHNKMLPEEIHKYFIIKWSKCIPYSWKISCRTPLSF